MRHLFRRLALKPYGDELLTRSGDFWIFSARLIIVTMALAEALAWGYMGSLMSREHPYLAAAFAAAVVFTLVWIVDATFMTLDVSRALYEQKLTGREVDAKKEKWKLAGGVLARVGIVTASLVITAPFLAQAIFAGDVRDEMTRRNAGAVATKRQEVERPFVTRLDLLRTEQRQLEQERVKEAAGVGPSGKYGRGPALDTIERQLASKLEEIRAVEASRASTLTRFDALSRPQLEQQYGISFLEQGVRSSAQLLDDMLKKTQFGNAETAVRAFLAFLFIGLLILKLFQPRSIAVYFNEQLHSLYDEYRKGLFDNYLPVPQRAAAGGAIDPLSFEDWCVNTYSAIRKDDERRSEGAREVQHHDRLIEQWQRLESAARAELTPLAQRHDAAVAAIDEIEMQLHDARTAAASAATELHEVESARASMLLQIEKGSMDGPTFAQAMAARQELDARRREVGDRLRATESVVERSTRRLDGLRRETETLREEIGSRRAVIADAQRRIADERIRFAGTVAGSVRS